MLLGTFLPFAFFSCFKTSLTCRYTSPGGWGGGKGKKKTRLICIYLHLDSYLTATSKDILWMCVYAPLLYGTEYIYVSTLNQKVSPLQCEVAA